jgi:cobalamin biosynthesis protein CobT
MENFRELEKELKRKQFSKKSLQHSGKGRRGGGDDSSNEDGDDSSDLDGESDNDNEGDGSDFDEEDENREDDEYDQDDAEIIEGEEEKGTFGETFVEDKPEERKKNQDYLNEAFLFMKILVTTFEAELESIKNKKVKGATYKKFKERQGVVQTLHSKTIKLRNWLDELRQQMDYVEGIHLKGLRPLMAIIMANKEDPNAINELEIELPKVLD